LPLLTMIENAFSQPGSTFSAVEIITSAYAVRGTCRGLSEQLRLLDLLNNPEITHLQLSKVAVRGFKESMDIVSGDGPIFIDKDAVILGRSLASAEEEAKRNEVHRFDYVEKDKLLMLVFAPPYRILGNIYMIKEADLTIALPRLFDGFLAMTEVQTFHEGEPGLKWQGGFIVVNGRAINMVFLAEQQVPLLRSVA
jgi:hypothetical protein